MKLCNFRRKNLLFRLMLPVCGLLFSAGAQAAASPAHLRLHINQVQPYSLLPAEGKTAIGMHVEFADHLERLSGVAFERHYALYARLTQAIPDGYADLTIMLRDPNNDARALALGVLHDVRYLVVSRKDAPLERVAALEGKTLAIARRAYYTPDINDNALIRKYELEDPFSGVRLLQIRRVDAVISTDFLLAYALRQPGVDRTLFAPAFQVGEGAYVLYARRDLPAAQQDLMRAALTRLKESPDYAEILMRYRQ